MSITLSNGVVLPDIPSTIPEEYSFRAIVKVTASGGICVAATPSSLLMVPAAVSGSTYDVLFSEATSHYLCALSEDGSTWGEAALVNNAPGYNLSTQEIVWANHDILVVTSGSADGITVGTEIYFPNSVASTPPFILPDGTELPALPEGCFKQRPYGFITAGYQNGQLIGCVLYTGFDIADYTENVLAGQQINALVCHAPNFMGYEYEVGVDTTWKAGIEDTSGDVMMAVVGTNGDMSLGVAWSNFDIFHLDYVDDDGNRVLSDTLYHRSDVNYRIYGGWLNSMGNQARRLWNVSRALKPGEMETVFSGATLEPLTVTPTSEEQTFTPESPCIGFSVVTVEAAEKEIEYIEVPVEVPVELPTAEDLTFDFSAEKNYGFASWKINSDAYNSLGWYCGNEFTPKVDIWVAGARFYTSKIGCNRTRIVLWDVSANSELCSAWVEKSDAVTSWLNVVFPRTHLQAGKRYTIGFGVSAEATSAALLKYATFYQCTANSNLTLNRSVTSNSNARPGVEYSTASYFAIDIVFDVSLPTHAPEYAVQYSSLEQLANEVERITGATGVTSVSQCIGLLQTVPAMTT